MAGPFDRGRDFPITPINALANEKNHGIQKRIHMPEENAVRPCSNEDFKLILQLETSLLGWLRTSLALMGFGFVLARFGLFLREIAQASQIHVHNQAWLARVNTASGTGLIILGIVVMLVAVRNHQQTLRQIERGELKLPSHWSLGVILCLILCALGMGMAIYLSLV
jgi:putative membrane protein